MKKTLTLLMIVFAFGAMNAQNMMDSTKAGFENIAVTGASFQKKAYCEETWYGKTDSAFYRTDAMSYDNSAASMCFDGEIDAIKKIIFFSKFPTNETTISAGTYVASMKIFLETGNTINKFSTEIGKVVTSSSEWNISDLPRGEWVNIKNLMTVEADIPVSNADLSRYTFKLPVDATVIGNQVMYLDDNQFETYTMDTVSGNYLNHYYYGFECGTENNIDGVFIPTTSDDYVSFSYEKNMTPSSNLFALKFDIPAGSGANYSIQLGNNTKVGAAGSAIVPAGTYDATLKVYMDEYNVSQLTSAISVNSANTTIYQNIVWDIPEDIALGEWVTLHQVITFANDVDSKITFKALQNKLVDNSKNGVFYIDDLAFTDYTPSTAEEIYSFDGGYLGGEGVWYTTSAADYFSVADEMVVTGKYALKFACVDSSLLPETKLQIGIGQAEVANSYVALDAGNYDVSFKLYLETGCNVTGINMNIKDPWTASSFDFTGVTQGEWVSMTAPITLATATASDCNFQIVITEAKYGEGTFYIDDITMTPSTATTTARTETFSARIFPNPASGLVNIEAEAGSRISIYSISGNLIKNINNASALTTLSTDDMTQGVYLVSIENNNTKVVEKLQVK